MKKKIVYTDTLPEVDEVFDYAVNHNLFLTKQQIGELFNRNTVISKPLNKEIATVSEIPDGYMSLEEFKNSAIQHIRTFAKENGLYK